MSDARSSGQMPSTPASRKGGITSSQLPSVSMTTQRTPCDLNQATSRFSSGRMNVRYVSGLSSGPFFMLRSSLMKM